MGAPFARSRAKPGLPDFIKTLDLAACALLVEVHGESKRSWWIAASR